MQTKVEMVQSGTRIERIMSLSKEGKSPSAIATEVKCSRQYVHQALHGKTKTKPETEPRKPEYEELLTVSEAARFLRVTANTMRRWGESGVIDSYRIGPRKDRRFKRTEVLDYLGSCKVNRGDE